MDNVDYLGCNETKPVVGVSDKPTCLATETTVNSVIFMKIKPLQNREITLLFIDEGTSSSSQEF